MEGTFQRFKTCPECDGKGEQQEHKKVELADHVRVDVAMQPTVCTTCKGTGRIDMVDEIKARIEINRRAIAQNKTWSGIVMISVVVMIIAGVIIFHQPLIYLAVAVALDLAMYLFMRSSTRIREEWIADDEERIEIIEHMDTKAKHGLDPDPLFVDGQRVADVTVELNGAPDNHNYQDLPASDTSADEAARDARRMQNMRM